MKKRHAQMHGEIFVYILAAIVVSLIFIFGYRAVVNFRAKSEQVAYIQFKSDITNLVRTTAADYGSLKKKTIDVPPGIKEVCFVDLTITNPTSESICSSGSNDYHPMVCDSWKEGVRANVFLIKDFVEEAIFAGDEDTGKNYLRTSTDSSQNFVCIKTPDGKLRIQFEGRGSYAVVSEWS